MRSVLSAALAAALALPAWAEVVVARPTVAVSSSPVPLEGRPPVVVGALPGGPQGRAAAGVGVGLSEGKPLQVMVWGGAGAIVGSMAGPAGTVVGAAAGSAFGLLFSMFVVPRVQPGMAPSRG